MSVKMNVKDKLLDDTLDLSCCDLKEVPVREIAVLRRATNLDLSNNILTTLPKNFVTLTQVIKLDLSKNMLTEIPENFGEMVQLKHLDLYKNEISRLPLSLGNLKNLRWLDLKENPLTPAVASVAGPCSNAADCQACAKNVVTYLANVKLTIEEEQKRITAAAAETEKLNVTSEGKKKESKKKKKDDSKKNPDKEKFSKNQQSSDKLTAKHKAKSAIRAGRVRKGVTAGYICRSLLLYILWFLFITCFILVILAIIPIFDRKKGEVVFKHIKDYTGIPMSDYYKLSLKSARWLKENTRFLVNQSREFFHTTYRRYFDQNSTDLDDEL